MADCVVQPDSELGDHVAARPCALDDLAQQLRRPPPSIDVTRPRSNRITTGSSTSPSTVYGTVRSATSTPSAPSSRGATKISPPGSSPPRRARAQSRRSSTAARRSSASGRSRPAREPDRLRAVDLAISVRAGSARSGTGSESAREQPGVDESAEDLPAPVRGDGFEELEARSCLIRTRGLGEEDREARGGRRFRDCRPAARGAAARRPRARAAARRPRPSTRPRAPPLPRRAARRRRRARARRDEGRSLDEVFAPARCARRSTQ